MELRRIRDAHAKSCNYDFDRLATDWMQLDRWEKKKTVKLQRGRLVPAFPQRRTANSHTRRENKTTHE